MFDTNKSVEKILGKKDDRLFNNEIFNKQGLNKQGLGKGLGYGPMNGNKFVNTDYKYNPNNVLIQIQRLLDRLPEVTSVKGNLTIKLINGQVKNLKLEYKG